MLNGKKDELEPFIAMILPRTYDDGHVAQWTVSLFMRDPIWHIRSSIPNFTISRRSIIVDCTWSFNTAHWIFRCSRYFSFSYFVVHTSTFSASTTNMMSGRTTLMSMMKCLCTKVISIEMMCGQHEHTYIDCFLHYLYKPLAIQIPCNAGWALVPYINQNFS